MRAAAERGTSDLRLLRGGQALEVATLAWNGVGLVVVAMAAIAAHNIASRDSQSTL